MSYTGSATMEDGMIAHHIHDALDQVRRLQEVILERRGFRGFSGEARLVSGAAALLGAAVLASGRVPATPAAQLAGWGAVLAVALLANYGALAFWFLRDPARRRDLLALKPAVDVIPALAVGGGLTVALVHAGQYDLLFGTWMCGYGLSHTACRLSLPRANYWLGLGYLAAGAACLVAPGLSFLNPWPMGLVFFAGETLGGAILIRDRLASAAGDAP
jgi:hypothetical protein